MDQRKLSLMDCAACDEDLEFEPGRTDIAICKGDPRHRWHLAEDGDHVRQYVAAPDPDDDGPDAA